MSDLLLFNNQVSGDKILLPIAGKKVVGIEGFNLTDSSNSTSYSFSFDTDDVNKRIYVKFLNITMSMPANIGARLLNATFDGFSWQLNPNSIVPAEDTGGDAYYNPVIEYQDFLFKDIFVLGQSSVSAFYTTSIQGYLLTLNDIKN